MPSQHPSLGPTMPSRGNLAVALFVFISAVDVARHSMPCVHTDEAADISGQQMVVADPASRSSSPAAEPSNAAVDSVAGGALRVQDDDEAGICERLFKGLVFFLGREVPGEQLLFVIRAFGGSVAWQGEGSPMEESDERITHQVRQGWVLAYTAVHSMQSDCG